MTSYFLSKIYAATPPSFKKLVSYLSESWSNLLNKITNLLWRKDPKFDANKRLSDPNWIRARITSLELLLGLKGSYRHHWWHRRLDPHCRLDRLLMSELLFLRSLCKEAPTSTLQTIASSHSNAGQRCRRREESPRKGAFPEGKGRLSTLRRLALNGIYWNSVGQNPDVFVRLQLDADWFNGGLKVSPNKFVTIQVCLMGTQRSHKAIFEHPDLREEHPDSINGWCGFATQWQRLWQRLRQRLWLGLWQRLWGRPTWTGENGLKQLFDALLPDGGPYTVTYLSKEEVEPSAGGSTEPMGGVRPPKYWNLQIHCFYFFADIVALLGMRPFIASELIPVHWKQKDLWVKLPLVITDRWGVSRQVRVQILDWSSYFFYESFVDTCLAGLSLTHQDLMDAYKTRMHEAYLDPDTRAAILAEGPQSCVFRP